MEIIAEIGSTHDGSYGNACRLIDMASDCGADVVKFQTHIAEAETLKDAPVPPYFKGEDRFSYFRRTGFSSEQWRGLKAHSESRGVKFMSSPFSLEAVDLLEEIGVDHYKIPSGEVTNLPLLNKIAKTGKLTYLSSGMSNWQELDAAVACLKDHVPLVVMQCSSAYPCPPEQIGLNVIGEMARRWNCPVGFSDHAEGQAAAFAAAALGATVFEKHITFSKLMYGSDAPLAMEPHEFTAYCRGLKEIAVMLKSPVDKDDLGNYKNMKTIFEKSIIYARDISAGDIISFDDLAFKKPGDGISAARWQEFIGKKAGKELKADTKMQIGDLA